MSDWFSTAIEMQREILRAQQAGIDASREMLKAGEHFVAMQEAGSKAAKAQASTWRAWAALWGWK